MKTIEQKVRELIAKANDASPSNIMSDVDLDIITPLCVDAIQRDADTIGYDGFKGDADDYPAMIWTMLYNSTIRPTIFDWLNKVHPQAWFKLMYDTRENQQVAMGQEPDHTDD